MSPDASSRRQFARLTFSEPVSGDVTASHAVRVLDLSLGGARLDHTVILRPGSSCYLRLPVKQQVVTVLCQVIWSRAIGRTPADQGGTALLYQSGVQFSRLPKETHALLTALLGPQPP